MTHPCNCISCQCANTVPPQREPDPKYQAAYESWCADMDIQPETLPQPCTVGEISKLVYEARHPDEADEL